jgi:hypothetical protein
LGLRGTRKEGNGDNCVSDFMIRILTKYVNYSVMKYRKMLWVGRVARRGKKCVHGFGLRKPEGK